jgi:hypothetical protein
MAVASPAIAVRATLARPESAPPARVLVAAAVVSSRSTLRIAASAPGVCDQQLERRRR